MTLLLCAVTGGWASTVSDLVTISTNRTIIFEDIMGGAAFTAGNLYDSDHILSVISNNYASNKGTDKTLGKMYCCRVKSNTQDVLAFKVGAACTLTIYGDRMNDRTPFINDEVAAKTTGDHSIDGEVTATNGNSGYATYAIPAAGTYYIIGSGSDNYLAGLQFAFAVSGPSFTLTTPTANTNVAINTSVVLSASEAISAVGGTISGTIKAGDGEASTITFDLSGTTLTYIPVSPLAYNTKYTVKLNADQVQNGSSVKNAEDVFTFTTMPAPSTTTTVNAAAADQTFYACQGTVESLSSKVNEINFVGVMNFAGNNIQPGSTAFTIGGSSYISFKVAKGSTYVMTPAAGVTISSITLYALANHGSNTCTITTGNGDIVTGTNSSTSSPTEIALTKNVEGKFYFTVSNESANNQAIIVLKVNYNRSENVDVVVSAAGYATLFYGSKLAIPEGVIACIGKVSGESFVLTEVEDVIPANCAVILKADAGTYNFAVTADEPTTDVTANELKGTLTAKDVSANSVYTLGLNSSGIIGMRSYTGTSIRAYSAYMDAPAGAAREFFGFGETTGINSIEASKKSVEGCYNLAGQRVAQPTKGLYIVNGKKVIIK